MNEAKSRKDVSKRERARRVRTVRMTLECAVVGCAGLMEATGEAFTQIDTTYSHRCSMCGIFEHLVNVQYPHLEYVNVQ